MNLFGMLLVIVIFLSFLKSIQKKKDIPPEDEDPVA